jgi:hypothetical protein
MNLIITDMKQHKNQESEMLEFRSAYEYAKRQSEKRRQKALQDKRTAKFNMPDYVNNLFNLITQP